MDPVRAALGLGPNELITSLDQLHQGAVAANVSYLSYRTQVYNYLTQTLQLSSGPDDNGGSDNNPTPFTDLPGSDHWAHDAIIWAVENGITGGTSPTTFSPDGTLTRSEAMTFLWAAAGRPSPESDANPFKDAKRKDWFYTAVLWAVENGVTGGTSPTTFSPRKAVTTGEMVTFLWAFAGHPDSGNTENPFSDVSPRKYYYDAILWAYGQHVLVGNEGSGSNLEPGTPCTRAYVVTYLYRYFNSMD